MAICFPGQGIEREAGRDFSSAYRAMADDDVLDRDQGEEQYESDDIIAADHELPEGLNHTSGRTRSFIAVQQNSAAGGKVERQPEKRE